MSSMEDCVGKTYDQIWKIYSAKHGDNAETRRIHVKWKELSAQVK